MTVKEIAILADSRLNEEWSRYVDIHRQLEVYYAQKEIGEDLEKVNALLLEAQTIFSDINTILSWIVNRNKFAINATNSYNDWIQLLIKGGAKSDKAEIVS